MKNQTKYLIAPLFVFGLIIFCLGWGSGFFAGHKPEKLNKCEVMVTEQKTIEEGRTLYYVCPRVPTSVPLAPATTTPATTTPITKEDNNK